MDGLEKIDRLLNRLDEIEYECHVAETARRYLRRAFGIKATEFYGPYNEKPFINLCDEAESRGILEPRETDELDLADLVLVNEDSGDYLLAEVSFTIQQRDIDRAAERSRLLAKATARAVTPLAIGSEEAPDLHKGEVQVLLIPEPCSKRSYFAVRWRRRYR